MKRKSDYDALRIALMHGHIKTLEECLTYAPSLFEDAGINQYTRGKKILEDANKMKIEDIYLISDLIGLPATKIFELIAK